MLVNCIDKLKGIEAYSNLSLLSASWLCISGPRYTRGITLYRHKMRDVFVLITLVIVGLLVGWFGLNGPLRQYFSQYRAVS